MSVTAQGALIAALPRLKSAGITNAATDARALLAHAMGIDPSRLTLHLHDTLTPAALTAFQTAISARSTRQPVSQIIGQRLFWGRPFRVTPDTLDPRPETEILVAEALRHPFSHMLDLGTGTGCILLSCLADRPQATGLGTDISAKALGVAQSNADALSLSQRTRFQLSDWATDITETFDLIVSNPPYIAAQEMAGLAPEVLNHEPHLALTPGGDGLDPYRILARQTPAHLRDNGRLLLEIGPTQAGAVTALLGAQGFTAITCLTDLDQRPRVISARKPANFGA